MGANAPPPPRPQEGATYKEVLDRLATVSKGMSDQLRTLGIGTVVFCWGLFTADKGLAQDVANRHRTWIVITSAAAVMGLLTDLFQAIVAYWVANRLRRQMEVENAAQKPYPYETWLYRSQTWFFWGKSVLMPAAAISIIVLLFIMVCNAPAAAPAPVTASTPPRCCISCPDPAPASVSPTPAQPTPRPRRSGRARKERSLTVSSGPC
jgi:hypothetical protein